MSVGPKERTADPAISVLITRRVRDECRPAFELALKEFVPQSIAYPGHLGAHIVRPPEHAPGEYVVVLKFRRASDWQAFLKWEVYQNWLTEIRPLLETDPIVEEVCGLETWFSLPESPTMTPPPRWKMAITTWLAVCVVTLVFQITIRPVLNTWPWLLSLLIGNALVVATLTWIAMPLTTRALRPWLYPPR